MWHGTHWRHDGVLQVCNILIVHSCHIESYSQCITCLVYHHDMSGKELEHCMVILLMKAFLILIHMCVSSIEITICKYLDKGSSKKQITCEYRITIFYLFHVYLFDYPNFLNI